MNPRLGTEPSHVCQDNPHFEQPAIYPSVRWIEGDIKKPGMAEPRPGLVSRIEEEEENETLRVKLPRCSWPVCEIFRSSEQVADNRPVRVDPRRPLIQSSSSRRVRPYGSLPTPVTVATTARERRSITHTVPLGGASGASRGPPETTANRPFAVTAVPFGFPGRLLPSDSGGRTTQCEQPPREDRGQALGEGRQSIRCSI